MFMKPKEITALIKAKDVKIVDLKFCDIHGRWQHFSIPAYEFSESIIKEGLGFDGSSIRGWKEIEASDMLVIPDPETAFIDPFIQMTTLSLICDIEDPTTRKPYNRSPRGIARLAEEYLKSTGIGDISYYGPEAEFFIFDDVRYDNATHHSFCAVDSNEAIWGTGSMQNAPSLGYKIRHKEGYLPCPPSDKGMDLRNEMTMVMNELGLQVERQHHEVATAGQAEIDIRYDSLHKMGDKLCLFKYIVKNTAYRNGRTATFMPKPLFGDNGSGMHIHTSIWKNSKNIMAGDLYAGLSQEALWYIGGILKHAPALCLICNPTNNSYKRLVPGYEAPAILSYSASNRSAVIRIPVYSSKPDTKRIEFRCPDPAANPYLAFSAMLMAGLDGIQNKIDPGEPMDVNLYNLTPQEFTKMKHVPDSLRAAIEAFEADHAFLLKGNVFSQDFIENFVRIKRAEYDAVRLRPHPYEFHLYYDV